MINKERVPYIIIIILVVLLILREGCNKSSQNDLIADIADYKTEVTTYKTKKGIEVAQNKTLMLENQEQIKSLLGRKDEALSELMKEYKRLKNVTIINNMIEIRDSISFDSIRIPCDFEPFPIVRDSSHYAFNATIGKDFLKIDSLKIPDKQSIVFGKRKMGFLKRREYTVEVVHSNPLIKTTNIGSYAVKEKRKKIVLSIGVSYGLNMATGRLQPVIAFNLGFPIVLF